MQCGTTGSLEPPGDQGASNGKKVSWQSTHPPHFQLWKWPSLTVARSSSLWRGTVQTGCWPWITEHLNVVLIETDVSWAWDSVLKLWAAHLCGWEENRKVVWFLLASSSYCSRAKSSREKKFKKNKIKISSLTQNLEHSQWGQKDSCPLCGAVGGDICRLLTSFLGTTIGRVDVQEKKDPSHTLL